MAGSLAPNVFSGVSTPTPPTVWTAVISVSSQTPTISPTLAFQISIASQSTDSRSNNIIIIAVVCGVGCFLIFLIATILYLRYRKLDQKAKLYQNYSKEKEIEREEKERRKMECQELDAKEFLETERVAEEKEREEMNCQEEESKEFIKKEAQLKREPENFDAIHDHLVALAKEKTLLALQPKLDAIDAVMQVIFKMTVLYYTLTLFNTFYHF